VVICLRWTGEDMKKIQKETMEYRVHTAEIAGAIAVVVSIIYLAAQIGESRRITL